MVSGAPGVEVQLSILENLVFLHFVWKSSWVEYAKEMHWNAGKQIGCLELS
jgi:hypothetical protein